MRTEKTYIFGRWRRAEPSGAPPCSYPAAAALVYASVSPSLWWSGARSRRTRSKSTESSIWTPSGCTRCIRDRRISSASSPAALAASSAASGPNYRCTPGSPATLCPNPNYSCFSRLRRPNRPRSPAILPSDCAFFGFGEEMSICFGFIAANANSCGIGLNWIYLVIVINWLWMKELNTGFIAVKLNSFFGSKCSKLTFMHIEIVWRNGKGIIALWNLKLNYLPKSVAKFFSSSLHPPLEYISLLLSLSL